MSKQINWKESDKAKSDFADWNVTIRNKESQSPPIERWTKIAVYAKKKGSDADLEGESITEDTLEANRAKIEDGTELNIYPKTQVKLWNSANIDNKMLKSMQYWGGTLVILSSGTDAMKSKIPTLNISGDFVIWYTETTPSTTFKDIVTTPNRGVFLDSDKQGKLLYTLTNLLHTPGRLPFTVEMTVPGDKFKGIPDPTTADELDSAGYSYYAKTEDWMYPRGFWLGKKQARRVYIDKFLRYIVKTTLSQFIARGVRYDDSAVGKIEAVLIARLGNNPYIDNLLEVSVPYQPEKNKPIGLVEGIYIKYEAENEVRKLEVTMESAI